MREYMEMIMILNLHKPVGWTSFDVVKKVRSIIKEKKVGHGGTLDPFAEGVLIIGTGKDTKKLTSITSADKTYIARLCLGEITDTLDTEGQVIEAKPVPEINADDIHKVLDSFLGTSCQIPPMFSAKKVNGQRLYKLARKNIEVKREPVQINIKSIGLLDYLDHSLSFSITCSKGTYIRVLGKDIAEKLGTVGYLKSLVRMQVGPYSIDDSKTVEEFQASWKLSAA
jgi:tRNA pseudouridine55 synthase